MSRTSALAVACATLVLPPALSGHGRLLPEDRQGLWAAPPESRVDTQQTWLPEGRWRVRFENGVVQTSTVRRDGASSVTEPGRSSDGRARARGSAVVIVYGDDRTERWTQLGSRLVVEHWFPSSQFPAGSPVRGIAERVR